MLTAIEIENFKAFGKRTRLELAPITLIFGENSVGKSSALKALSFIQHCMKYGTNEDPLPVTSHIGSFAEFVHHPVEPVCFRLEMEGLDSLEYKLATNPEDRSACIQEVSVFRGVQKLFSATHPSSQNLSPKVTVDPAFFLESLIDPKTIDERFATKHESLDFFRESLHPNVVDLACKKLSRDLDLFVWELSEQREKARNRFSRPDDGNENQFDKEEFESNTQDALERWTKRIAVWKADINSICDDVRQNESMENWLRDCIPKYVKRPSFDGWIFRNVRVTSAWGSLQDLFVNDFWNVRFGYDGNLEFKGAPRWIRDGVLMDSAAALGVYVFMYLREQFEEFSELEEREHAAIQRSFRPRFGDPVQGKKTKERKPKLPLRSLDALFGFQSVVSRPTRRRHDFRLLREVVSIPAVRLLPQRVYEVDQRFADRNLDQLNSAAKLRDPRVRAEVNQWLLSLKMPEIEVRDLTVEGTSGSHRGPSSHFQIVCETARGPSPVSIVDVGFGISQVIPLVIECCTNEDTLITIEQPESQIHPVLQTDLADLFIWSHNVKGNRFLIETHSEYIFHRFRKRIRFTSQQKEEKYEISYSSSKAKELEHRCFLRIYYFHCPDGGDLRTDKKSLDRDGDLGEDWPTDFFVLNEKERGILYED